MTKWEYTTCYSNISDQYGNIDPTLLWKNEDSVWNLVSENGLAGWELVSVTFLDPFTILYTFKRPIIE